MTANSRIVAALSVIAFLAVVVILRQGRAVLIPLVLSVLISYALAPLVAWLQRRHVPRLVGTIAVMLIVSAAIAGGAYTLRHQAVAVIDELPKAARTLREQIQASLEPGGALQKLEQARSELQRASENLGRDQPGAPPATAPSDLAALLRSIFWWGSTGIVALAGHAVVIFFLVFFMLLSGDLFRRKLLKIAGPILSRRKVTLEVLDEIDMEIKRYLLVRILTSLIVAVATWLALKWTGLHHAAIWGLVAGVCNVIPYLGPVIVSGGLGFVGLLQFGSLPRAALVAAIALLITSLEGWLVDPPLMGRVERMNAVAVLVGLVFWTWIWGAWGALLAVPMLSVTKTICDHVEDLRPIGELLGE